MVIAAFEIFKIGQIVVGTYQRNLGEIVERQPFLILREATKEEWIKSGKENGVDNLVAEPGWNKFYEVSTD